MAEEAFVRQSTEKLLDACQGILAQYGGAITVRQLYYRLVAAGQGKLL